MKRGIRNARRGKPPSGGEPIDVLVRLEHADEQRDRPLRQRLRRHDERLEIHVRGKVGGGLDAELVARVRR